MNKVVADALTLVYKFLMPLCSKFNPALIERGLLSIAGEDAFDFSSQLMPLGSYEKVQSTLARLNERESIRKNKGVYYTPTDVVDFIVANTIKASLGVLTPENIHSLDLASEFDEDFCSKKTVFEPTCGAGEFLLATLEQKLKLWRRNHFEATKEDIECIVGTFYGNDINIDSVIISKLRLFLCVAHRYGVDYCVDLPNILNRNFTTNDYVVFKEAIQRFDICIPVLRRRAAKHQPLHCLQEGAVPRSRTSAPQGNCHLGELRMGTH